MPQTRKNVWLCCPLFLEALKLLFIITQWFSSDGKPGLWVGWKSCIWGILWYPQSFSLLALIWKFSGLNIFLYWNFMENVYDLRVENPLILLSGSRIIKLIIRFCMGFIANFIYWHLYWSSTWIFCLFSLSWGHTLHRQFVGLSSKLYVMLLQPNRTLLMLCLCGTVNQSGCIFVKVLIHC